MKVSLIIVLLVCAWILYAMLFPSIYVGPGNPKRAKAKNDVVQIANAVTGFEMEYGHLPGTNPDAFNVSTNAGGVLNALMGNDTNLNPKKFVFLEVLPAKNGKNGLNSSDGTFRDPWGNIYQMKLDTDNDKEISNWEGTNGPWGTNTTLIVRKRVAVWSTNAGTSDAPANQRVSSWD